MNTADIKEGQMVHAKGISQMKGKEGQHIGTVDHLDGERYIKLKRSDSQDGMHHWIPVELVSKVEDDAVYLTCTQEELADRILDSSPN